MYSICDAYADYIIGLNSIQIVCIEIKKVKRMGYQIYGVMSLTNCVNNVITPIPLPLFSPIRSTVPLSRNRGSATRIRGKHKDKVLYRGIGGV